ncbi:hypothetical protein CLU79DRAFT_846894 [Phycomyces nitens]|nr:hypothetical protein CLU79DRAFT_846894 [Phycomyces nitens]
MSSFTSPTRGSYSQETSGQRSLSLEQQQGIAAAQAAAGEARRTSTSTFTPSSSSLYVGELDPSVQESTLYEVFNKVSPVESVRICRDAITRRSLGYAYVNFKTQADGEKAIGALNYTTIKGKPCRIMWSQRDPSKRKAGSGNVFVKNLDSAVGTKELHDTFAKYGNILSCKVVTDESDISKGYGFVHYETEQAADNAISNVNGLTLYGKVVYVGHYISKRERETKIEEVKQHFTNIYVKNLVSDIKDEELQEEFGKFGPILSLAIQRDDFGVSKGYGFINYENHEDAERAVQEMHDTIYLNKRLFVCRAQKKSERKDELLKQHEQARLDKLAKYQGVNLYVKNLCDDIDDDVLREEFLKYGPITSAKIMKDEKTGVSKGFGFVCFTSADDATRAVAEMNGCMLSSKPIYVALAQKKDDRRSQLEAQRQQVQLPFVPPTTYIANSPVYYGNNSTNPYPQPMMGAPRPPRWSHPVSTTQPVGDLLQPQIVHTHPAPVAPTLPTQPAQPQEKALASPDTQQLTMAGLTAMDPEAQRQTLGERIYRVVHAKYPNLAGKVTGMLLELKQEELIYLINNPRALENKALEAVTLLEKTRATRA